MCAPPAWVGVSGMAKRVLITGGTSGIGLATALRFARSGAQVAVIARSPEGLARAEELIREAGGTPHTASADVTDRKELEAAIDRVVARMGGLDVAVANVGAAAYGPFTETAPEDFDRVIDVTLRGNVDTARAVLPHLERSAGALVMTGSAAADIPMPLMSAYTAAKHGIRGFVDALGMELRGAGSSVKLALVEPGPVDTPFWGHVAAETGQLPPPLPLAYHPDEVAIAIERAALGHGRRTTVGGMMIAARALRNAGRPVVDRLIAKATDLASRAGDAGTGAAAIWNPTGNGTELQGIGNRPSLLVRGMALAESAVGQLGRTNARDPERR